ncbi:MAG: (Fe-S)-binding protein [Deltaproteobacteria bacterium]|uniref:(Fe-S)-binding protein n=1 Tax=Candidatus Zymogenus saltonus TaxID=2844893 RepID=A0A9D8PNZ0_9DELT|nr:(Fe-S)-binding protein [Candidatus Zymogenus saltonus]
MKFKYDKCDKCGVCLEKCPEVQMDSDSAKEAITQLIEGISGRGAKKVLGRCSSCFSCNIYCPKDADPYYLVLERWNDIYKEKGAPPIFGFVCPNRKDNAWTMLNSLATDGERSRFRKWAENEKGILEGSPPKKNPLILGNYGHLFPHITDSPLFDNFTVIDPIGHWESGAYLMQAGYSEVVEEIGSTVKSFYDALGNGVVYILTDAVNLLMSDLRPDIYGIEAETKSFTHALKDALKGKKTVFGKVELKKKVGLRLSVHDSCYAKAEGDAIFDAAREVLKAVGAEIVELDHIRYDSLCCGFGRGAADIPKVRVPFEIMKGAMRKLKEAEDAGADGLVTYCTGCMYLLWSARELMGSRVAVYHLTEPVTMAMGEYKNADLKRQRERAWDIISQITYTYTKSLFQGRFKIGDVSDNRYSPEVAGFYPILRIIRALLSIGIFRKAYALGFRALTRVL